MQVDYSYKIKNDIADIDKYLHNLLLLVGNEESLLDNEFSVQNFRNIIVFVEEIRLNIRWCSNTGCPCHPETQIRNILERDVRLKEFLIEFECFDYLDWLINNSDQKRTVFDKLQI